MSSFKKIVSLGVQKFAHVQKYAQPENIVKYFYLTVLIENYSQKICRSTCKHMFENECQKII